MLQLMFLFLLLTLFSSTFYAHWALGECVTMHYLLAMQGWPQVDCFYFSYLTLWCDPGCFLFWLWCCCFLATRQKQQSNCVTAAMCHHPTMCCGLSLFFFLTSDAMGVWLPVSCLQHCCWFLDHCFATLLSIFYTATSAIFCAWDTLLIFSGQPMFCRGNQQSMCALTWISCFVWQCSMATGCHSCLLVYLLIFISQPVKDSGTLFSSCWFFPGTYPWTGWLLFLFSSHKMLQAKNQHCHIDMSIPG